MARTILSTIDVEQSLPVAPIQELSTKLSQEIIVDVGGGQSLGFTLDSLSLATEGLISPLIDRSLSQAMFGYFAFETFGGGAPSISPVIKKSTKLRAVLVDGPSIISPTIKKGTKLAQVLVDVTGDVAVAPVTKKTVPLSPVDADGTLPSPTPTQKKSTKLIQIITIP
jgi:hypothetical protein